MLILWRQAKVYATSVERPVGAEGVEASGAGVLEEGVED
jgi:hypothetical protein